MNDKTGGQAADALMGIFGFKRVEGKAMDKVSETRRVLFEAEFHTLELRGGLNSWTGLWEYDHPYVNSLWQGWIRCAKSSAKRAGGAE